MPIGLGTAVAGSSALSAVTSLIGSGKASSAAKNAANMQMAMYNQNVARMQPWVNAGSAALPTLNALITPGQNMTDTLRKMPGYQFMSDQGLKSTQSGAAARGLGVSGASLKGAATFATGLADQYYSQLFNNTLDVAKMGENAAAGVGTAGTQAASSAGNYLNQQGIDQAAGVTGVGNAATSALNNYLQYQLLQKYLPNSGTTTGYDMSSNNINLGGTGSGMTGVNPVY